MADFLKSFRVFCVSCGQHTKVAVPRTHIDKLFATKSAKSHKNNEGLQSPMGLAEHGKGLRLDGFVPDCEQ